MLVRKTQIWSEKHKFALNSICLVFNQQNTVQFWTSNQHVINKILVHTLPDWYATDNECTGQCSIWFVYNQHGGTHQCLICNPLTGILSIIHWSLHQLNHIAVLITCVAGMPSQNVGKHKGWLVYNQPNTDKNTN